jgi:ABC-type oligopeptide transport system ATPase subunit
MSPDDFKDSATQDVSKTLLIGVAGATGSGKTESGIRIGLGIAKAEGGELFVIDTENKRALNKKNRYRFKHMDMQPPYSPERYREAIETAMNAGAKAIFLDSFSHEWDGDGGLSEDAATILERMSKGDAARAERLTMLSWKEPKLRHKKLMSFLRKCDVPIIFGLRAEPKVKFQKDANGKQQIVDAGWLPIAEKMFGFDMLIYALMMPENPGVPVHLKKLEPEFEPFFPIGQQITEQAGVALAAWARPKDPAPPLTAVLKAISDMADKPSRDAAKALANRLVADDDIDVAKQAYAARIEQLRAPAEARQEG